MDVVAYVRVSLDCPVEDVLSRDAQVEIVSSFAKRHGHRVVHVACDEGASATTGLEGRIGLGEVFEWMRDRRATGVAVARLERLAADVVLQELLFHEVRRLGGSVVSCARGERSDPLADPEDPHRALVRQVIEQTLAFGGQMRDVRVRQRAGRTPVTGDRELLSMSIIEHLAEQGADVHEISGALTAAGFGPRFSHAFDPAGLRRIVERLRRSRFAE